jgi:hypothetical protein
VIGITSTSDLKSNHVIPISKTISIEVRKSSHAQAISFANLQPYYNVSKRVLNFNDFHLTKVAARPLSSLT